MSRCLIFDTETTGLIRNLLIPVDRQPRIVEYFGHVVDDQTGEVLSELEFLCDPLVKLSRETIEITHITPEMIKGKPMFSAFANQVAEQIESADEIVAHNLAYDLHMIEYEFARLDLGDRLKIPAVRTCTVQQTEWLKGHRLSLTNLHQELFGTPFEGAHRAREDVEALTRCFLDLRGKGYV